VSRQSDTSVTLEYWNGTDLNDIFAFVPERVVKKHDRKGLRRMLAGIAALTLCAFANSGASLVGVRVAVTIDDLPGYTRADGMSRSQAMSEIIAALKRNQVPGPYGFVTEAARTNNVEDDEVLREWTDAGYRLGNHTASHRPLSSMTAAQFISDIAAEDAKLSRFPLASRRVFRYPGLDEGDTLDKRVAVRAYLNQEHYVIAQVTTQYYDWAWTRAYVRCLGQNDRANIQWLKSNVSIAANIALRQSTALACRLFGHDIPLILLVHPSGFTAQTLDSVLAGLRAQGVRFITFDEAATDPAYRADPDFAARFRDFEDAARDPAYSPSRLANVCRAATPN
jgi:peptidoglycan-N-acetylglucosamine deacetylase